MVRALPVASACLISLVDRLVKRDFLTLADPAPLAGLQVGEQLLLVGFGQRIAAPKLLGHASSLQLLQQVFGRFFEFRWRTRRRYSMTYLVLSSLT